MIKFIKKLFKKTKKEITEVQKQYNQISILFDLASEIEIEAKKIDNEIRLSVIEIEQALKKWN